MPIQVSQLLLTQRSRYQLMRKTLYNNNRRQLNVNQTLNDSNSRANSSQQLTSN